MEATCCPETTTLARETRCTTAFMSGSTWRRETTTSTAGVLTRRFTWNRILPWPLCSEVISLGGHAPLAQPGRRTASATQKQCPRRVPTPLGGSRSAIPGVGRLLLPRVIHYVGST